ncbi:MAG: DnaD domain-containing protein [Bacilli bacterium]
MKKDKMVDLLSQKNIVIPMYIYRLFPRLNIDLDVFIFLMYLYNCGDKIIFNPQKISEDFGIDLEKVLYYIDKLSSSKLIGFEIIKNDKNISEEYISLSYFYDKISLLLIEEANDSSDEQRSKNIFELIEKEFGRVLSPMEYEIIKAWNESNISDELIEEALREAVFNGVTNLRYIDKILYEWQKRGIKNKNDVEKNRQRTKKDNAEKMEIFEYNWLEDDE